MLSDIDKPRPRPPAKARRAMTVAAQSQVNSTPPPAYAPPFAFPSRGVQFGSDIHDMPVEATRHSITSCPPFSSAKASSPENVEWMNEKSREELHELLLKAHGIIKEREQELGLATNIVKKVYDHNVTLKSKHEALLAKIPFPTPDPSPKPTQHSHSISESTLPHQIKPHTRKISIAMADISLLADQNAELLNKLQKMEEDATTADIAGRRELKRLEKEIAHLRDALEKTQAKSEELEGKVQDAVTFEAVKRRKELESMRNDARNKNPTISVLDFAPPGSKYGGPSGNCSLLDLPEDGSPIRIRSLSNDPDNNFVISDQVLASRLLSKVKELEETNARILRQQVETANQLADVQQDALSMSKVYELLSDHDAIQLELEPEEGVSRDRLAVQSDIPTIRFRSLRKNIEDSISQDGSFVFPGTTSIRDTKTRKTVFGLFDEQDGADETKSRNPRSRDQRPPSEVFGAGSRSSIFSQFQSSDHPQDRTLLNELETFGQETWNLPSHMHTGSLSNLSEFSVPSTPTSESLGRSTAPDQIGFFMTAITQTDCEETPRRKQELPLENSLQLSVEPPSPSVDRSEGSSTISARNRASRLENMSRTLRSRKNRWVDRISYDKNSVEALVKSGSVPNNRISNAMDNMNDGFRAASLDDETTTTIRQSKSDDESGQNLVSRQNGKDQVAAKKDGILIQAWLWFQFAIVVLIFIFSMARKGPATVLGGAQKSRTG